MTHTGLMAFHIAQFLKAQKFKACDAHYYHSGAQVEVIDPFNGQKYRVMVEPIYENKINETHKEKYHGTVIQES